VIERPSLVTQLDGASAELDRLLADVRLGIRSQAHFDELEDRAQAISRKVRTAFRQRQKR
jgi:hypothetical protein